jgi:acyl-homoserine lactone acylase PvdQ
VRVLGEEKKYNLDKVIKAGYDTRLSAFEVLIPALIKAYENLTTSPDSTYLILKEAIGILKSWDYRTGENSVATTLAVEWGQKVLPAISRIKLPEAEDDIVSKTKNFAANASTNDLVKPLLLTLDELQKKLGKWQVAWGEINRFQRISSDIDSKFDDGKPSIPVGFASSAWGMLPSYTSRYFTGTKKRYGVNGNSFIAAVEFGKKLKAKSLLAGGESGDINSKHFFDQGIMYSKGQFKDVLFYKEDVMKFAERKYHPGD